MAQTDGEPPSLLISRPTRGEHLSASEVLVEGSASDAGSGVTTVLVNGRTVTPDPVTGGFSATVPLGFGVNLITVEALDGAGNAARFSGSVMSSAAYLPAGELVPSAAVARLTEPALQTIGDRTVPLLQQWAERNVAGQTLFRGEEEVLGRCVVSAIVVAEAVTFDPPQLVADAVPTGLQTSLRVPNVRIPINARSYCGIGYRVSGVVSAQAIVIDSGLALSIDPSRAFDVSITSSAVSLQGFDVTLDGVPGPIEDRVRSAMRGAVDSRLAEAMRTLVPGAIRPALARLSAPISGERNGRTVTLAAVPAALTFDDGGVTVAFDGSVTADPDPTTPTAPGSVFSPSPALPSYPDTAGFYTSIHENLINRALFGSWQAGFWDLTIDQAFLDQAGFSLPFPFDASLLVEFFPALQPMIPAGQPAPLAVRLEPRMPPVVWVSDEPGLLRLGLGELDVIVTADLGAGFVPLLTVATYVEAAADPVFTDDTVSFTVLPPARLAADLLDAPVSVAEQDVDRFIQFVVPSVIELARASIRPIPVPAFPGFAASTVRLYPDDQAREFVTLQADVQ